MKFGIIGAGNHAQKKVMPAIVKAGHEISAIYSRDVEKAKKIGLKYLSKPYNDMETFLTSDFDAVYISSPNSMHHGHAMASLKSGKHVLLEKPMTIKTDHAEDLVKVAHQKGLVLSVGFHLRFHPAVQKIRKMIEDGEIGKVTYLSGTWAWLSSGQYNDSDRRWWGEADKVGGGSVMASGVHVIDSLNYILKKRPQKTTSMRVPHKAVIDSTECISLNYGDEIANALSSRSMSNPDNSLYVFGTEGSLVARNVYGTEINSTLEHNGEAVEKYNSGNMYEDEIRAFSATRMGNITQIADGSDGLSVVKTVNAAFDADYMGKWVDIQS